MSFYRNPWAPGLSIPGLVDAEPFGRGVFTTAYLRRRTIADVPPNWKAGYAVPRNVLDSPPGSGGKLTTNQIKRRTISQFIPDFLMHRGPGDSAAVAETPPAAMAGLGAVDISAAPIRTPGYPGDPIAQYGREVASYVMTLVQSLPASDRKTALREALENIDPQLWNTVAEKAEKLERGGMAAKVALQRALAASLADGFAREIVQIGLTGKVPRTGQVGLAAYPESLSGFWDKVKKGLNKTTNVIGKVGQAVKNASCRVISNPGAAQAAAMAGASQGIPPQAGANGMQLAGAVMNCPQDAGAAAAGAGGQMVPPQIMYMPAPAAPFPIVPVALIGGAAVIAIVLLTRKG